MPDPCDRNDSHANAERRDAESVSYPQSNVGSGATIGPLENGPPCCIRQPWIDVRKLSVRYAQQQVLCDVSLSFNRGCLTTLIGPSGCGKTTFLTCLNRLTDLVPSCHVEGQIHIDSLDVRATRDLTSLRRRVGMIFQKPNPFPLSIRKNIEMPLKEHGMRSRQDRAETMESALVDVGLWDEVKDRLDASALTLSGGQQQRLCIARAIALEPEILLLDEPCSALDPISSQVVEDLMLRFRGRYTLVVVTHNLQQARRIADDAAFFWTVGGVGNLIEHGSGQRLFESPREPLTIAYLNGKAG